MSTLAWALVVLVVLQTVLLVIVSYQLRQADEGDLNHDGRVDLKDLVVLARNYGKPD